MDKDLYEKKISSKEIFKGEIIELYLDKVKLPNNRTATREKVSHPGAVGVVPLDEKGNISLVKQFRYPIGKVLMEIPAGKLDKGEIPLDCARRELKEEIGAVGGKLIHLASYYSSPGFCDEIMHLYLAVNFVKKENNPEDDEFLQIVELKMEEVLSFMKSGKLKDAKTIIGILLARDYLIKNSKTDGENKKQRLK